MGQQVKADISMSLDGFITGPDDGIEKGLGEGGERLHEWLYGLASWRERHGYEGGTTDRDAEVLEEAFATTGAILMGRRMFDIGEAPWGDDPPFHMPVFVLTHEPRDPVTKRGGTTFTFIADGLDSALEQARTAAGDQDVSVCGGANILQQCLSAGLLDEMQIHLVPILLGDGVRLFDHPSDQQLELETTRVIESPAVTHLKFRVPR